MSSRREQQQKWIYQLELKHDDIHIDIVEAVDIGLCYRIGIFVNGNLAVYYWVVTQGEDMVEFLNDEDWHEYDPNKKLNEEEEALIWTIQRIINTDQLWKLHRVFYTEDLE